jgi:hypothetical protein
VQGDDALVAGEDGRMPPQAVFLLPLLPRLTAGQCENRPHRRGGDLLDERTLVLEEAVESLAEVLYYVEAVGDLARSRSRRGMQ